MSTMSRHEKPHCRKQFCATWLQAALGSLNVNVDEFGDPLYSGDGALSTHVEHSAMNRVSGHSSLPSKEWLLENVIVFDEDLAGNKGFCLDADSI